MENNLNNNQTRTKVSRLEYIVFQLYLKNITINEAIEKTNLSEANIKKIEKKILNEIYIKQIIDKQKEIIDKIILSEFCIKQFIDKQKLKPINYSKL